MAGRPREFDRDVALAKARDLFWARGYEGTSMAELVSVLGLASARIYAAFGSKEALFREAIALYETNEGGFVGRALGGGLGTRAAIERVLVEAIELYTSCARPGGCMVVSAATNCAPPNDGLAEWLAQHRRDQTATIIARMKRAVDESEWHAATDIQRLGDLIATLLHGLSVQARDGVPRQRLLALIPTVLSLLPE